MYKEENIIVFVIIKFCHKNGSSQQKCELQRMYFKMYVSIRLLEYAFNEAI